MTQHFHPAPEPVPREKSVRKGLPKESAKRVAARQAGTWVAPAKQKPNAVNLHHLEQHQFGKHTFAARHALDISALREETQRCWLASLEYAAWEAKQ